MSEENKYVTVPCRVPDGLLKDGETLEFRVPKPHEEVLSHWDDIPGLRKVAGLLGEFRPVIIPPFDSNAWAEKNLPKPACEMEVWTAIANCGWMI